MASGGRREGAGRKASHSKRVTVTVRVLPETRERIAELKKDGVLIGKLVDDAVAEFRRFQTY